MSSTFYRLIPTNPDYMPEPLAQIEAGALFVSFVQGADDISTEVSEHVVFWDQGENFETVSCPVCGRELTVKWWQDAMDVAFETGFSNLDVVVPCCKSVTTLNDLRYDFPAGFARFALSALNPHVGDLEDRQVRDLERILCCRLRKIWQRL